MKNSSNTYLIDKVDLIDFEPPNYENSGDYRIEALAKLPKINGNTIEYTFGVVSDGIKENVRNIVESQIEPFLNINFEEVPNPIFENPDKVPANLGSIDIVYTLANVPYAQARGKYVELNPDYDNDSSSNGFQGGIGTHGFMTLIHETLHVMGLHHPGNYNGEDPGTAPFLPYDEDHITNTVMSYNFPGNSASTPMPYDLLALQYLYGASNLNSGNTNYTFDTVYGFSDGNRYWGSSSDRNKLALWDKSGIDTLDFSNLENSNGYFFDLNEGGILTTQAAYNASSYQPRDNENDTSEITHYTSSYGTAIAYNTTIENAIGSSSDDEIIGNDANNRIEGREGDDTIDGQSGNDLLFGGIGDDELTGGSGNDELRGQEGDDVIDGGAGDDLIRGYGYTNEIDILTGGTGADTFDLGDGNSSNFTVFYPGWNWAIITDFNRAEGDKFEVVGDESDYSLGYSNSYGGSDRDTSIYYQGDFIALVQDNNTVSIEQDFEFLF